MSGTIVMAGMGRGGFGSIVGYGLTTSLVIFSPAPSHLFFDVCIGFIDEDILI